MSKRDDLLTTRQAAARYGTTVSTLNRLAAAGIVRVAVKLPGATGARLYRRADLDAAMGVKTNT